jgi:hypothetical protein
MGPRVAPVLVSLMLALALAVVAARAQDVFSTTTGGGQPLQGGVSVTEPAAPPGHTRPTGTQGIEGNPDCPPPKLADGTTPKNWSCTTSGQGVVGNPDCPAPVAADGTSPKNWSCRTGTQGVEGNPNCPPPALPNGLVPRNWSCAGPDMAGDPLAPLRDPTIPADYRGDPGVPPLMRIEASTDEEAAAAAVLTCRRAVVEGIERPSQAETAEYVCEDQSEALDRPPFQLRVEQTVCILPLKEAVEELKAGKMLLMKAQEASGPERDRHAAAGNGRLLRASISVDQSDICMVENPPQPRAARQRPPAPPVDIRAAMKNPCQPVAGLDPRLRGALDANCPKAPPKDPSQAQPKPQPQPQPGPQQAQQPQTDDPEGGCEVAQAPLDVRDQLMDLAHRLDRNADELQSAAMKGANRFFQGMNDVLQQQLIILNQKPGEPVRQAAAAVMAYLTNDALENHNKLLNDAQKAVEDFVNDPAYAAGKTVSNFLIGRVQGGITDRLPGGAKFCTAASRRATEEARKLRGAVKAGGELDKMAKQAEGAADGCKACRRTPQEAAQDQRFRAEVQKKQQEEARRAAEKTARDKARPQREQAAQRQAAAQQERNRKYREQADREKAARPQPDVEKQRIAARNKAIDEQRAQQARAMDAQRRQADQQRIEQQKRAMTDAQGRRSPATPDEAAAQRQAREAERRQQIADAKIQNDQRQAQAARQRAGRESATPEQQARADRRGAAGGDVPRRPTDSGDTVPMRPEGGDTVQIPREGGFGSGGQPAQGGAGQLKPLSQQTTPVNPFGQNQNCLPSSVAEDLRKKHPGRPYTDSDIRIAGADEPTRSAEVLEILRKHYGQERFANHTPARQRAQQLGIPAKMGSSAEISEELLGGAADSRGIVFVRNKATGSGHVVRAEREGGAVRYHDSQQGTDATMWATAADVAPDAYEVFFYRTN